MDCTPIYLGIKKEQIFWESGLVTTTWFLHLDLLTNQDKYSVSLKHVHRRCLCFCSRQKYKCNKPLTCHWASAIRTQVGDLSLTFHRLTCTRLCSYASLQMQSFSTFEMVWKNKRHRKVEKIPLAYSKHRTYIIQYDVKLNRQEGRAKHFCPIILPAS